MEPQSPRSQRMGLGELNRLSERILGAAFAVHTSLGPGLLESAYEAVWSTSSATVDSPWSGRKRSQSDTRRSS